MTDEDELLSTFGRGLGLVAMCALSWGVDVHDDGKIVWFEPDEQVAETPSDPVIDLPSDDAPRGPAEVPDDYATVVFDAMPVRLIADFRRHFREVRRELRLLALAHETDYPVAKSLTELFERVDEISLAMSGLEDLDEAIADGAGPGGHRVPDAAGLGRHDGPAPRPARARRRVLPHPAAAGAGRDPQQFQLQRWFLGEFQRQGRGDPPLGWGGTYQVDPSYRQSAS